MELSILTFRDVADLLLHELFERLALLDKFFICVHDNLRKVGAN